MQRRCEVELAYRRLPLLADYFRGWAGLALAALPLITMAPSWPVTLGLVVLIGLFVGFLVQTWRRQHSRVRWCRPAIALIGDGAAPAGLARSGRAAAALVRLARVRAGAGSSWSCAAAAVRLVLTSALDRFDELVAEAVQAAERPRPAARAGHPRQCRGTAAAAPPDALQAQASGRLVAVVRRLAGDRDVVDVALAPAGLGHAQEAAAGLHGAQMSALPV